MEGAFHGGILLPETGMRFNIQGDDNNARNVHAGVYTSIWKWVVERSVEGARIKG